MPAEARRKHHLLYSLVLAAIVAVGLLVLAPQQAQGQVAPLTVDKECNPDPVRVGQQLTCTIDVGPAFPATSEFALVRDTFPAGVTVTGAVIQSFDNGVPIRNSLLPCIVTGNTVECRPRPVVGPPIFPRAITLRVTIDAIAQQCGTFTNTAEATALVVLPNITVTDTEEITVVGCEGPSAPGQQPGQRQPGQQQPGAAGGGPVVQEIEQESQSGDVSLGFEVSNEGDYAEQCAPASQIGNSGNARNAPGALQYASETGDFEAGGIEFAAGPENAAECASAVQQSSGASG